MIIEHPSSAELSIVVNGERSATRARTLEDLLAERRLSAARVATALNGRFVPGHERGHARLSAGDHVEIVSPRQGG